MTHRYEVVGAIGSDVGGIGAAVRAALVASHFADGALASRPCPGPGAWQPVLATSMGGMDRICDTTVIHGARHKSYVNWRMAVLGGIGSAMTASSASSDGSLAVDDVLCVHLRDAGWSSVT